MIWSLTPQKVIDRINRIIDELGQYDLRIQHYESEARLAVHLLGMTEGIAEVGEWRDAHDEMHDILADLRVSVRSGALPYKQVAAQLPALKKAVRNFRRVLDQTDADAAAGRARARRQLGIHA